MALTLLVTVTYDRAMYQERMGEGLGKKNPNIYFAQFWSDLIDFLYAWLLDVYENWVKKWLKSNYN